MQQRHVLIGLRQTFGMMLIYIPIQLYLVDAFQYAASALAAAAVRSTFIQKSKC